MTAFELSPEVVYSALATTMAFIMYSLYTHRPAKAPAPAKRREITDVIPRNNRV